MYKRLLVVGIVALAVSLGTMRARGAESEKPVSLDKVTANILASIQTADEDDEKGEAKEKKSEKKSEKSQAKKAEAKEEDDEKDEGKPAANPSAKIPGPVQATAKKLIGKGKMLELARESDGTYELDYQVHGIHQAAIITVDGKIEEREITVPASTLPKAVIEAVKKLYPKGKISVAEKSTTKDGTVFELEVTETHGVDVTPEGKVK